MGNGAKIVISLLSVLLMLLGSLSFLQYSNYQSNIEEIKIDLNQIKESNLEMQGVVETLTERNATLENKVEELNTFSEDLIEENNLLKEDNEELKKELEAKRNSKNKSYASSNSNKESGTYIPPKQSGSKVAYLTFDDGPNGYTSKILNILKKYNAKGTFFVMEGNIRNYKSTANRMLDEGHYIAGHSITHDAKKLYSSPSSLIYEMNETRNTIKNVTGVTSNLIRVPYGSKPYIKKSYRDALVSNNLKMWDWNVDSNDWRHKGNPDKVVSIVTSQVSNLNNNGTIPVILFHDNKVTVDSLPTIIEYLYSKGYTLKSYSPNEHFMINFWGDNRL